MHLVDFGVFVNYIYNADYIVTDSFHATVFSLMFHKALFVFAREGSELRMKELLENTGMTRRFIDKDDIPELDCEYDEHFSNKWDRMINDSKEFLKQALQ